MGGEVHIDGRGCCALAGNRRTRLLEWRGHRVSGGVRGKDEFLLQWQKTLPEPSWDNLAFPKRRKKDKVSNLKEEELQHAGKENDRS